MRKTMKELNSSSPTSRGGPQSVSRIFSILDSLANSAQGATLSELALNTGAPKSSIVGLLAGLTAEGCLIRDDTGRYSLGPRFISLAMRTAAGRELLVLARPVLARLMEATGETAVIGALASDADLATYLDKVETSNPIRYAVTVGERRDLFCTALGKVLLANFAPERLTQYLKSTARKRFTATTVTKISNLRAELEQIRKDGVSRTRDERIVGASGLAAPIFANNGEIVAAVLIAGPTERIWANVKFNENLVKQAAAECTGLIGGQAAPSERSTDRKHKDRN